MSEKNNTTRARAAREQSIPTSERHLPDGTAVVFPASPFDYSGRAWAGIDDEPMDPVEAVLAYCGSEHVADLEERFDGEHVLGNIAALRRCAVEMRDRGRRCSTHWCMTMIDNLYNSEAATMFHARFNAPVLARGGEGAS